MSVTFNPYFFESSLPLLELATSTVHGAPHTRTQGGYEITWKLAPICLLVGIANTGARMANGSRIERTLATYIPPAKLFPTAHILFRIEALG